MSTAVKHLPVGLETLLGKPAAIDFKYGYVTNDGVYRHTTNPNCHADLLNFRSVDHVITWNVTNPKKNSLYEKFTEWLLFESPWTEAFSLTVLACEGSREKALKLAIEHGFLLDPAIPGNYLGNACIVTRQVFEHTDQIIAWDKFVKSGVDPSVAFFFGSAIVDGIWGGGSHGHHHPLQVSNPSVDYFENFVKVKLGSPLGSYKTVGKYLPCDSLWDAKEKSSGSYPDFLEKTYTLKDETKKIEKLERFFDVPDSAEYIKNLQKHPYRNTPHRTAHTEEWWTEVALSESKRMSEKGI